MADWDETTRGPRDRRKAYDRNDWPGSEYFNPPHLADAVIHATTGRFDSSKPNQANTPQQDGPEWRPECAKCWSEFKSYTCLRAAHKKKPHWIMHGKYAHVSDQPCALCNPPNELLQYRMLLAACYCPTPTPSGYKPLCMNCQEAATLVTKILERMNIK
jgi:hypothetical protein